MKRIVVLHRGWVSVGIRRWGTSKGLGELAEKGQLDDTIIDKTPTQRFPLTAVINTIDCNEANWK